jgi:hypothetical protein
MAMQNYGMKVNLQGLVKKNWKNFYRKRLQMAFL